MKEKKMELNYSPIATVLSSNPQEAIALLPRNGSQPTKFKLIEKTQLASIIDDFSEGGKAIAAAYVLDYGFRFLELDEICVFVPADDFQGNTEMRDRLKMNWVGVFSFSPDKVWCYYSLTKEAYLNRGQFSLVFGLPSVLSNLA